MNGTFTTEERQMRKRALESELTVVRAQKAEVLRAIGQISKKQRLGGPPPPSVQMSHEAKVVGLPRELSGFSSAFVILLLCSL
jgi:hypothetical protein